ncbi:response regulator [Deinococcus oregonensis]|uniref:Response regulator n=1 Tax=Deinococcus oregonensis TaxID=1805970 RepID=A0ABV6AV42_9DEIO
MSYESSDSPRYAVVAALTSRASVRRVLIIEDCVEDALLLGLAFEEQAPEVQVQVVRDGASGVACFQSLEAPEMVLLDLHLPGQMSVEILTQLQQSAATPFQAVCWSSCAHPAAVQTMLDHGAVAYLEKPREAAGFAQIVHSLLAL